MKKEKKTRKYVNKADLLEALKDYTIKCKDAEDAGDDKPPVPKYIGECIWDISKGIAMRPNFSGYPFRDDMIMDGVENCLLYMHNFDPEKTSNPFGYFTKIIWYAFLRRIAKEKKQMYIRYKSSSELLSLGQTYTGDGAIVLDTKVEYINDFIKEYEMKLEKKKIDKSGIDE